MRQPVRGVEPVMRWSCLALKVGVQTTTPPHPNLSSYRSRPHRVSFHLSEVSAAQGLSCLRLEGQGEVGWVGWLGQSTVEWGDKHCEAVGWGRIWWVGYHDTSWISTLESDSPGSVGQGIDDPGSVL